MEDKGLVVVCSGPALFFLDPPTAVVHLSWKEEKAREKRNTKMKRKERKSR